MDDTDDPRPNTTVVEESAGDIGLAVRVRPWFTVGAGYGTHDRTETTYGDRLPFLGAPEFLGEDVDDKKGISLFTLFTAKARSRSVAFSGSLSLGPAGAGAAVGLTFGR